MKMLIVPLLLMAASFAQAQQSSQLQLPTRQPRIINNSQPEPAASLSENYTLTLTIRDKNKDGPVTELSMLIAGEKFSATFPANPETFASFSGFVQGQENEAIQMTYVLSADVRISAEGGNVQTRTVSFSSTVRLRPGQAVQIFGLDGRTGELRLTKAADAGKQP